MKRVIVLVLVITFCLYGCSAKDILPGNPYEDEIVLPSIPTQTSGQNQPTMPQYGEDPGGEDTQAAAPEGNTYPWEVEFNETGYTVRKEEFNEGKAFTWIKGYKKGRSIIYYNNGTIEDSYYYPSGAMSHLCRWMQDGSYTEARWLDNGDVASIMPDGTTISGMGTLFYRITINTDGSSEETQLNSQGMVELMIRRFPDGSYQESRYDSEGFVTYVHMKNADYELELLSDENGKLIQAIENGQMIEDPAALEQYVTGYNFRN